MTAVPQLLVGKTAAITGGATGIGLAIARAYLQHGCDIAINHLGTPSELENLAALRKELDAHHQEGTAQWGYIIDVPGDITKPETGEELVRRAIADLNGGERLDIFISNAGVCKFEDFLSVSPDLLTGTIATNLTGAYLATQAAARQMALHQSPSGGSIIGISSISALVGGAEQTHYTPTKAGVLSLMQSAACALGKYGIRCNALLPGTIRTRLNEDDLVGEKGRYMDGRCALGRVGEPADLGGPAVFLGCEALSGYVTGAQLLVDGGLFVNLQ